MKYFLQEQLRNQSGGRILDVATSAGEFIKCLDEAFEDYDEVIGIDVNEDRIKQARETCEFKKASFKVMDAEKLDFDDASFDTVAIHNSLHHLDQIDSTLLEMKRVLKPGGRLIVMEVFQDPATDIPAAQRHVHHWIAEIDRICGVPHFDTLTQPQIIDRVSKLGLKDMITGVQPFEGEEFEDPKLAKAWIEVIGNYSDKVEDKDKHADLLERGQRIKKTIIENGVVWEPELIIIGRK